MGWVGGLEFGEVEAGSEERVKFELGTYSKAGFKTSHDWVEQLGLKGDE
jgi:hypothetical protein